MKQSAETEAGRKFQFENGTRPNPGQGLRIGNDYIEGCYHCRILVRLFGCIGASPFDKAQMMKAIDWLQMGPGSWLCPRCKDDPMARASAPQRSGRAPLVQGFLPVDGNGNFAGFPAGFGGKAQNDPQQPQQPGAPAGFPAAPQPQQFAPQQPPQQFAPPQQPPQQFAPPQQPPPQQFAPPQQPPPGAPAQGYPPPQQPPAQFQQPGAPATGYAPQPQGYPPPQQAYPQQQPQYAPPQQQYAPQGYGPPQQQPPPQGYAPPQAFAPQPAQPQAFARAPYSSPPRRARSDWRSHAGAPAAQGAPPPPRHVSFVTNPVPGQEPDLARARAIASGDPNAPQPALPSGVAPTLPAAPDAAQSSSPPQE